MTSANLCSSFLSLGQSSATTTPSVEDGQHWPSPFTLLRTSEEARQGELRLGSAQKSALGSWALSSRKAGAFRCRHVFVNGCRHICVKAAQEVSPERKAYCLQAFIDTSDVLTGTTPQPF